MKERPMLFSAPMVRAICDGTKTQTRRIVKNPDTAIECCDIARLHDQKEVIENYCPYGKPDDQLWVRETFQPIFAEGFDHHSSEYPNYSTGFGYAVSYPATDGIIEFVDADDNIVSRCTPSIHMPRWASRIQLKIVRVRVERLNDISVEDAIAEGVEGMDQPTGGDDYQDYWRDYGVTEKDDDVWPWFAGDPISSYKSLWEKINGSESWQSNPWVWVIEFKRVNPNEIKI
jgi:hypothetical protein